MGRWADHKEPQRKRRRAGRKGVEKRRAAESWRKMRERKMAAGEQTEEGAVENEDAVEKSERHLLR